MHESVKTPHTTTIINTKTYLTMHISYYLNNKWTRSSLKYKDEVIRDFMFLGVVDKRGNVQIINLTQRQANTFAIETGASFFCSLIFSFTGAETWLSCLATQELPATSGVADTEA